MFAFAEWWWLRSKNSEDNRTLPINENGYNSMSMIIMIEFVSKELSSRSNRVLLFVIVLYLKQQKNRQVNCRVIPKHRIAFVSDIGELFWVSWAIPFNGFFQWNSKVKAFKSSPKHEHNEIRCFGLTRQKTDFFFVWSFN